jgi:leucyl aminopeptidase
VALGPELPAMYANSDATAESLMRHAGARPTRCGTCRCGRLSRDARFEGRRPQQRHQRAFAGSVTAALFLQEFVGRAQDWVHLDIYRLEPSGKPGRPEGAEAQTLRAVFALIAERASGGA